MPYHVETKGGHLCIILRSCCLNVYDFASFFLSFFIISPWKLSTETEVIFDIDINISEIYFCLELFPWMQWTIMQKISMIIDFMLLHANKAIVVELWRN